MSARGRHAGAEESQRSTVFDAQQEAGLTIAERREIAASNRSTPVKAGRYHLTRNPMRIAVAERPDEGGGLHLYSLTAHADGA